MKLLKAQDIFDEARRLLEHATQTGDLKELDKAERLLNELLDNNIGNITVLYVLASLHLTKGHPGLAIQLLNQVCQYSPQFGEAWNNLSLAFKEINQWDKAAQCGMKAASVLPHPYVICNVSALHLNRGKPEIALEWANRALEKDPNHLKAQWHKSVALLELGQFGEGWDLHESRLDGGGSDNIAVRNYHAPDMTPWWDGKSKGKVVIHGEQGMGDEIMFATCMKDAIATGADIVFEPSPRLEGLFQRSFPEIFVHGTDGTDGKGWIEERGKPDFKCAVGTLPKFYRRKIEDFPGDAYLVPDPEKKAFWDGKLKALGNKKRIGIAWQGGVHSTRMDARSFHPRMLGPLYKHDVQWVSLQYDKTAQENVADVKNEFGVEITHWPKAVEAKDPETGKSSNLDELAALVSCLDLVITVPQTAYHVAGGLGVPCWVLTPSEPDWRLMVEGTTNPWYSSVELIRQRDRDWLPVLTEVDKRLEERNVNHG